MNARQLHVVLVHPEIHWNTGNAGRTCLAAGAQLHLIEPLGFSLDDKQIRRAGLDYWPHVQPKVWPDWDAFRAQQASLGEPFFFTSEASRLHTEVVYPRDAVLLFGAETTGLPSAIRRDYSDHQVRIPMQKGQVRSLNLSTAVGIAVFEVVRQWGGLGTTHTR